MLPNYDARAVADVLGLSFLRLQGNEAPSRPDHLPFGTLRHDTDTGVDVVVVVDDTVVFIRAKAATAPQAAGFEDTPPSASDDADRPSPSSLLIERAVESGLPRASLRHVAESITGGDRAKVSALEWGVVPKTTLDRREIRLSVPESERTERIARLFVHARRALGTEAEAREFMTAPHPELDGRSPVMATKTDLGTRRIERVLTALEYGLAL